MSEQQLNHIGTDEELMKEVFNMITSGEPLPRPGQ